MAFVSAPLHPENGYVYERDAAGALTAMCVAPNTTWGDAECQAVALDGLKGQFPDAASTIAVSLYTAPAQ